MLHGAQAVAYLRAPKDQTMSTDSSYFTFSELQKRFAGASRGWLYAQLAAGRIPQPVKIGGRVLWLRSTIEKFEAEIEARNADPVLV